VKQVAERWRVSRSVVYALVAAGVLRSVRVGLGRGTIRVSEDAVLAYERDRARDDSRQFEEHFA
jgi:excisionase family DNA binding protein